MSHNKVVRPRHHSRIPRPRLRPLAMALAAASLLSLLPAQMQAQTLPAGALPSGLTVAAGQAQVAVSGSRMTVVNTPQTILNWNSFNIGANAAVNFQQASASSAVLNRVTGADPSSILGSLSSNGRVWLLNPNGVIFGAGARVDVAGLVTSTLRLNDSDWLAGRYSFSAGNADATVLNQGELHSSFGGTIALLGDSVRNEGLIQADGGQIILAAGKSIELVDTGAPNLGVRITADAGAARNLGNLQAAGGRIDIHAAAVNQSGIVSADGFGTGPGGEIWIKASGTAELTAGSRTTASSTAAAGGSVVLLGQNVGLLGSAQVQADGAKGGGSVNVGGGERGQDARFANATAVFFGPGASISADATSNGDGGRIVLWSDAATRAYGSLSARGGLLGGKGGFIETSGGWLDARPAKVDTYAPRGTSGIWLLDPFNLTLSDDSNESNIDPSTPGTYSATANPARLSSNTVQTALNSGTSVIVSTGPTIQGQGGGPGVITVDGANINASSTATGTGASLTLSAAGGITVNNSFITLGGVRSTGDITLFVQDGPIALSNSTLQTSAPSGQVRLGGGAFASGPGGEVYTGASSSFASTPAVSISNSNLIGGNFGGVTIDGIGRSGIGVQIQSGSNTIAGGTLAITAYSQSDTALDLEGGTNLQAFSSFSLRGTSMNGTGSTAGVLINGASINSPQLQSSTNLIRGQTVSGSGRGVSTTAATIDSASALVIEGSAGFSGSTDAAVSLNGGIVTAQGNLTLRTFGNGQRVEVAGTTVSANGNITLQAADTVFLDDGTTVNATGKLSLLAQNQPLTGSANLGAGGGSEIFFGGASGGPVTSFFAGSGLNFISSARWIVFATDPAASGFQPGSNLKSTTAFTRYGATSAADWAGDVGNGFVFSAQKTASYTASVSPRSYDGTVTASITGSAVGSVAGDAGTAIATRAVSYANADAGSGKTASFSVAEPFSIHGSDGKPVYGYTLSGAPLTGTVTKASLSMEGASVPSRVYDGTTAATVVPGPLSGLIGSETLGVTVNAAFANKNVSLTPKAVTATYTLSDGLNGGKAGNYQLTASPALTGTITPRNITPSGLSAQNKTYDGTTVATLNGTPLLTPLPGDSLSLLGSATGDFADKNVGTAKSVSVAGLSLNPDSIDFRNYQLSSPSLSANIGKLALAVTGLVADDKIYDRTLVATISGTPTVSSPVTSDAVSVTGTVTGTFASFNQGTGKTVNINGTGLTLGGADAGNYTLLAPSTLLATITPRPISWSGLSVAEKVYDGTTTATVLGSASVIPLAGDTLAVNGTPSTAFPSKNAATYSLDIAGLSLGGASAGNYALIPPAAGVTASITRRPISITGFADNKVYDGTPVTGTFNLHIAPLAGDELLLFGTSGAVALFADPNVGTAKPATLFGVTVGGASVGNYAIGTSTFQADITKRPLTLSGLSANSKTYDASTLATITGTPILFNVVEGEPVTMGGKAFGTFADKNVGTGKNVTLGGVTPGGPTGSNYSFEPLVLTADITQATVGLTGLAGVSKVYDGSTTATLTGTARAATFGNDVVTLAGTASGVFNSKDVLTANAVSISGLSVAGGADAGNYIVNLSSVPASISPRPLIASGFTVANKVYDGSTTTSAFTGSPSVTPLPGDDVQLGFIPGAAATARFADKNVGTNKALTVSNVFLVGASASNYALGFSSTASITPLAIPVTLGSALNKVYDSSTLAYYSATATATPLAGDSITVGGTAVGAFASKNVGKGIAVSYTGGLVAAGPDGSNYTFTNSAPPQTADITPSPLGVFGIAASNKVYDGTTVATITGAPVAGVFAGDSVSVKGSPVGAFTDRNVANAKPVDVTGLDITGPDAGNYVLGRIALTAEVIPLARAPDGLNVASRSYDGSTVASVSGVASFAVVPGDTVTISGVASVSFIDKQVGTDKTVIYNGLALGGANAGNYALLTQVTSKAAITALPIAVGGLSALGKVYDASTAATLVGTPLITPVKGDSLVLAGSAAGAFADKNVGAGKLVNITGLSLSGADAANYTLSPPAARADITPLVVQATGLQTASKVYDGNRSVPLTGAASVGAIAGDAVSLGGTPQGLLADKGVGSGKTVSVSGLALAGADAGNYSLAATTLTASVTPKVVTVSGLSALSKVYDGNAKATLSGTPGAALVPGDDIGLAGTLIGLFSDRNIGSGKEVQLSGLTLAGSDAANYRLNPLPTLKADITPRNLTVVGIGASSKIYDGSTLAPLTGVGSIAPVAGDAVALAGTASGRFEDKNVGSAKAVTVLGYSLAGADAGNYTLTIPQGLRADITPLTLTVSGLQATGKVYDSTAQASLSGLALVSTLATDNIALQGTPAARFDDANVGSAKPVTVGGYVLSGPDAANYRLLQPQGLSASIAPAPLQYESTVELRTVGEPLGTLGGRVTGFVAGETLATATSGTTLFKTTVLDTNTPGIYPVLGSGLTARNYSFAQAAGNAQALTVNAPPITLQNLQTAAANPSATPRDSAASLIVSSASLSALLSRSDNSGVVDAAVLPQTLTVPVDRPGSVLAAGAGTFGAVRLASMSAGEVSALLGRRAEYTQQLFAEASNKLKANPKLADLRPCTGLNDAASGQCAITPELKARIAAQGGLAAFAEANPAPPQVAVTAAGSGLPNPVAKASPNPAPGAVTNAGQTAAEVTRRARAAITPAPTLAELQRNKRSIKTAALPQIERKIALVVGVGSYDDEAIPQLANAVGDARAVARVLETQLGYEPVVLENATKATLVAALNRLALTVGPRDSVMVYYAGHGELVETTQLGYWLLSDSDSKAPETWLSNADISRLVAQIGASQVALISDSCYSGSLVSEERIRALPQGLDPQVVLGRKSVVVMSSGGNQPVFDDGRDGHSPFAWHFMNTINQMADWQAGGNIFERVRFAVARALPQRPQYSASSAAGHVPGGDYLFEQRRLNLPTP